jgi:hypothetical protein
MMPPRSVLHTTTLLTKLHTITPPNVYTANVTTAIYNLFCVTNSTKEGHCYFLLLTQQDAGTSSDEVDFLN